MLPRNLPVTTPAPSTWLPFFAIGWVLGLLGFTVLTFVFSVRWEGLPTFFGLWVTGGAAWLTGGLYTFIRQL